MKYTDVTLTLESGMRGVEIETAKLLEKDGWNARNIHLYSHSGTHMDSPVHFGVNSGTIDIYPPERFFVSCYLISLDGIAPFSEIGIADLGDVKDRVERGEGLIFRTGWSKLAGEPVYRNGIPSISQDLAAWCVQKGISMIGVEPPSVADVNNLEMLTEIHRILLNGNIIIVEGLANLDRISQTRVKLVALPLKIKDGDGAPCRAIIIED